MLHRVFATTFLLLSIYPVIGQEYIRGATDYFICDTSIIRSIGKDSVLIYNNRYSSTFIMESPWIYPDVPKRKINPVVVNDFEVVEKRVYFCGYVLENNVKKGVYGSFSLNTFFSDTILSYAVLDTCTELKKLDYYRFGNNVYFEDHLVMVGTTGTRSDALVHTIIAATVPIPPAPPYGIGGCDVFFSTNEDESFDDIAVTDNYVVVSMRSIEGGGFPVVNFCQFDKPSYTLGSFLNSSMHNIRVVSPAVETPVFLEHYGYDKYAAVYKVDGYSRIAMLRLNAPSTVIGSVEITVDEIHTIIPIDIKYNKKANVFDILARDDRYRDEPESSTVPAQIYHVTSDVFNDSATYGRGTRFTDRVYKLWSIDPMKESLFFVSSGDSGNIPYLFKYTYFLWNNCPERFDYYFECGLPKCVVNDSILPEPIWYENNSDKTKTFYEKIKFRYKCPEE